jgi:hypothetical protein
MPKTLLFLDANERLASSLTISLSLSLSFCLSLSLSLSHYLSLHISPAQWAGHFGLAKSAVREWPLRERERAFDRALVRNAYNSPWAFLALSVFIRSHLCGAGAFYSLWTGSDYVHERDRGKGER